MIGFPWETLLEQLPRETRPLKQDPVLIKKARALPKIVNVVATATLLPPKYTLPLKTIARSVACAQYTPRMFAATILKFTDSISSCAALVFSTGSVVAVSLRSENHARYLCQMLRVILESVRCAVAGQETTFAGRLRFESCEIHNTVGSAELGYRIDLKAAAEAAPACCKWFPEWFPGLECKIWLNENYRCECGRAGKAGGAIPGAGSQRKCSCVVKLLIFDTGRLVITGARRLQDVNAVYFRIKAQVGEYKNAADRNFYGRLGSFLRSWTSSASTSKTLRKELKPDVAVACVLAGVSPIGVPNPSKTGTVPPGETGIPPFMQMALAGRVEVVKSLYLMDPTGATERDSAGRDTLQRLASIPSTERTPEQTQILNMLSEVKT